VHYRLVNSFFAYARARHEVFLRRRQNFPPPWTDDPILQQYRFTNIFRETDRTTQWFREHVRDRYDGTPQVLLATVVFRWFNKIETGEAMFEGGSSTTPFEYWAQTGHVDTLRQVILAARGTGPYVNGAYIIKSPNGMNKLDGVLWACEQFRRGDWLNTAHSMALCRQTLYQTWEWVRQFQYQGDFTAYEVVTDLRHTHLLRPAPDIMTWANAGPGAKRGLNRLACRPLDQQLPKDQTCAEMRELLQFSRSFDQWPPEWGQWEMREVEHTLCEWDKYERVRLGEGTPKQRFDAELAWGGVKSAGRPSKILQEFPG
jgi:5-hmdU DNA kinase-like protein